MIPPKAVAKMRKRLDRIAGWRYAKVADVPLEMAETMDHLRTPPVDMEFEPIAVGETWGRHWATVWFRGKINVPRECRGRRVYYRHASFCEKLLFVDGKPFSGMNIHQPEVLVLPSARGGEQMTIHVEAYTGHPIPGLDPFRQAPYTHQFCESEPGREPPLVLEASELAAEREAVSGLFYDADTLLRTALLLDENSLRRARLLDELNRVLDTIPMAWDSEDELDSACQDARKRLAPLLNSPNAPTTPTVGIVGHAHIDVGWLWPVKESIRKSARSFTSVLALMDAYPELRFQQSQPLLYDMIERHYPDLLGRLRKRVKEGRWEPNGGMWVEADCNLPGGESLVRQFLEGTKKTVELFGYRADTLWLPDVFGYSAALPQILRQCDIQHFVTSKINWNDTNRFPFTTFWWEGIDGTEIFTHFLNTSAAFLGYNSPVYPESMQDAWDHALQKETQDSVLASVGWGDGGGGPTRDMAEYARRMKNTEGCPKTTWVNVSEFLTRLRTQDVKRPRWTGELYLELHRGTYTAQARTKRYNRKLEFLLREVELYAAMAMLQGAGYPAEALQNLWRKLLTNQFHDILPGSSIRSVYEQAEQEYAEMEQELRELRSRALDHLGKALVPDTEDAAWLVANPLAWPRQEIVTIEAEGMKSAVDAEGNPLPSQPVKGGVAVRTPTEGFSVAPIALRDKEGGPASPFQYTGKSLETPVYTVAFDKAGKITRLLDKDANREVVREGGRLNDLYTAEDMPGNWDAWDIDRFYRSTVQSEDRLLSREVVEDGPLFITLRSRYRIGRHSTLTQDMVFYAHARRIDFRTDIEWEEAHRLLKTGFDLNVHAVHWRNEIQFGHVVRNLHANTSWDQAQFEVCAHKWVDVSEGAYGAALLNDCKYGHDSLDRRISITLLKSPRHPDEEADRGRHSFTYALLPHTGPFSVETVVREAYALNQPLTAARLTGNQGTERSLELLSVSRKDVVVEAVKKAETDDALIVRLYDAGNSRGPVTLTFDRPIRRATECNLLEDKETGVRYKRQRLMFDIRPFEIKTFKVHLR